MMTTPPGRTAHHDGDGCTGQHRTVDTEGADDIGYHTRRLIICAAEGRHPEAVIHGDWAAVHYGAPGEFFLCAQLAHYVLRGDHGRPSAYVPLLPALVPEGDLEAAELLDHVATHRGLAASPREQFGALKAARFPLNTFILHFHKGDTRSAEWQWSHLCQQADEAPLLLPAFGATLALWAARATFGTRHTAAQAAPLNQGTKPS
jgi:hypothetical protein